MSDDKPYWCADCMWKSHDADEMRCHVRSEHQRDALFDKGII